MKTLSRIMAVTALVSVAGCGKLPGGSLVNTFMVEPLLGLSIPSEGLEGAGQIFSAALGREYQTLARIAAEEQVNWIDASAYAAKSRSALLGQEVMPWAPSALGLSGEIDGVYSGLVSTLGQHGGSNPVACARAQALYDAYSEALSEGDHSCADPAMLLSEYNEALEACGFAQAAAPAMPAPMVTAPVVETAMVSVPTVTTSFAAPAPAPAAFDACSVASVPAGCTCATVGSTAVMTCERVVTKEVIRTVEVPKTVTKTVIREIPRNVPVRVEVPVVKEVIRTVEVPRNVIKTVEVPREVRVEVPVEVIKRVEVPVEVVKQVVRTVEVPRNVPVIREVEKRVEVPVEVIKRVEVPVEVEVVRTVAAPSAPPAFTPATAASAPMVVDNSASAGIVGAGASFDASQYVSVDSVDAGSAFPAPTPVYTDPNAGMATVDLGMATTISSDLGMTAAPAAIDTSSYIDVSASAPLTFDNSAMVVDNSAMVVDNSAMVVDTGSTMMAAPAMTEYTVYFGYDRSDLTAEARGVIDEAVSAFQSWAAPFMNVIGHTDTKGSKAYNQRLAQRRADAVADAIVARGVDRGSVRASAQSELAPAVSTGDGVREALNRRVTISFGQ